MSDADLRNGATDAFAGNANSNSVTVGNLRRDYENIYGDAGLYHYFSGDMVGVFFVDEVLSFSAVIAVS
jgi:hypothetical protein